MATWEARDEFSWARDGLGSSTESDRSRCELLPMELITKVDSWHQFVSRSLVFTTAVGRSAMPVWMVRAGRDGQREEFALQQGLAVIGWDELPDLSAVSSRAEVETLIAAALPDAKPKSVLNYAVQVWSFVNRIGDDDLVILPLKTRGAIAVGKPTGDYEFRSGNPPGARHVRPVTWIRDDIPRTAFDQDLLYSLGAFMTVCQIRRNNAEERIKAILSGRPAPPVSSLPSDDDLATEDDAVQVDIVAFARDQLRGFIGQRFKGHEMARLVNAVLQAQGYHTQLSPAGPDGGVDIIGGKGPMGFEAPHLVVQVKSSDDPADVKVLRELQGVMQSFDAERGLLVCWGGFKRTVYDEARQLYFQVRLWDSDDLLDAIADEYDNLPDDLQAELPLQRIWTLVLDE